MKLLSTAVLISGLIASNAIASDEHSSIEAALNPPVPHKIFADAGLASAPDVEKINFLLKEVEKVHDLEIYHNSVAAALNPPVPLKIFAEAGLASAPDVEKVNFLLNAHK